MDLAPCGWESSHKRQPADSCVLVGFGFVVFFLDSIYKDLTYFLGKFWAGIEYSSDLEEARRAPVSDLYSIHYELIVSPLQLN